MVTLTFSHCQDSGLLLGIFVVFIIIILRGTNLVNVSVAARISHTNAWNCGSFSDCDMYWSTFVCCTGSAVQASVEGLETSVLYRFWMQAVTAAGPGHSTDVIRIITPSDKLPSGQSLLL